MRTQTSWTFSPDEFAWVWASETGLAGDYPHPLKIIETPTTAIESDRIRAEISERYPAHADPDLIGPLRALANPDLRIICNGAFDNSTRQIRSHAAAVADLGVILFQKSGRTADFGGDVQMVVTTRRQLGKHIAATMPSAPAGAAAGMTGNTARVRGDEPPSSWLRNNAGQLPVEERIRILLRAQRTAQGYLRIDRYLHDRNPHPSAFISWIDVAESSRARGRYIIDVGDNDTIVVPASAEVVAGELHRRAELDHI